MRSQGFTLLELLLAMALSLLLTAILIRIALVCEQTNNTIEDALFLQENGRLAMHMLGQEISTTGYIGCARLQPHLLKSQPTFIRFSKETAIQISTDTSGNAIITIQKMATDLLPIHVGDLIAISDCAQAFITIAKSHQHFPHQQIARFIDEKFYVRDHQLYRQYFAEPAVALVDGLSGLHATLEKNAVMLQLDFIAPHGMTTHWENNFLLQERIL